MISQVITFIDGMGSMKPLVEPCHCQNYGLLTCPKRLEVNGIQPIESDAKDITGAEDNGT